MKKSVLISIQPYYVFLIIARLMGWNIPENKTVEVRKNFPQDLTWDKVAHIYCSKNRKSFNRIPKQYQPFMEKLLGKVMGEFVCDRIELLRYNCDGYGDEWHEWNDEYVDYKDMCLSEKELEDYLGKSNGYAWHISDLKIYDTPKELGEFAPYCEYMQNIDGESKECLRPSKYGCKWKRHDLNPDGSVNIYTCAKRLIRPFQSWGYVDE